MIKLLKQLRADASKNNKLAILRENIDNQELKKLLAMTYDKVTYTYGITLKNIKYTPERLYKTGHKLTLLEALQGLERSFCTRDVTGHDAIAELEHMLESLPVNDAVIIGLVLGRDLKIGLGRTLINKVFPKLIVKPPYMRCGIYSAKSVSKFTFPALVQEKCDGRYVSVIVESGAITFQSRSGEEQEFPELRKDFKNAEPGVYIGELLVDGEDNRAKANGQINSSNPPHEKIYMIAWDFVTLPEWSRPKDKEDKTMYSQRFRELKENTKGMKRVTPVITKAVTSTAEALKFARKIMADGGEGAVLKDRENIFRDCTSPTQLKIKVSFDIDVEIVGFTHGTKGTRREGKVGAIVFSTADDKEMIHGQTSGFSDDLLDYITDNQATLLGTIMTVEANDITKSRSKSYWALSHPRFIEFRPDKKKADTFTRAMEQLNSGKEVG